MTSLARALAVPGEVGRIDGQPVCGQVGGEGVVPESVFPEAVDTFPDGEKALNRGIWDAGLLAYVRSLEERIAALEGP